MEDWKFESTNLNSILQHAIDTDSNGYLCAELSPVPIDVFFIIDTTFSMRAVRTPVADLVDSIIKSLKRPDRPFRFGIIKSLKRPDRPFRFGFITFHDSETDPGGNEAEVVRDLTSEIIDFEELFPLETFSGGGDQPEAQYRGLRKMLEQFKTDSTDSAPRPRQFAIVISDAPPLPDENFLNSLNKDVPIYSVVAHFRLPMLKEEEQLLKKNPQTESRLQRLKEQGKLVIVDRLTGDSPTVRKTAAATLDDIEQHEKSYDEAVRAAKRVARLTSGSSSPLQTGFEVATPDHQSVTTKFTEDINEKIPNRKPAASWIAPSDVVEAMRTADGDLLKFSTRQLPNAKLLLTAIDGSTATAAFESKDDQWQVHSIQLDNTAGWTLKSATPENPTNIQDLLKELERVEIEIVIDSKQLAGSPKLDRFLIFPARKSFKTNSPTDNRGSNVSE